MAFEGLSEKLSAAFKKLRSKGKLTETDVREAMREVRLALLEADVNYKVAKDFTAAVAERAIGSKVMESLTPAQMVIKIVNEELCSLMGGQAARLASASRPPCIVMMCGLQGSGKTTQSAKLAKMLKSEGHRPLLAACDVYRPAAIKQLQVVGEKAGVPVFEMGAANPVEIAKKAVAHARDYGNDYLILDTAGRLHIDEQLMDELKDIKSAVNPHEILFVVDAMTGQDAVNAASAFNEALGIDGVILTKLDSDTRGGAALSVRAVTGKPIKFAGMGEKLDDFEVFHPERMASRILGMGDVLSLIEKAERQIDLKQAEELARKMQENKFDFNDMLEQFRQIGKMGDIKGLLSMVPGIGRQIKDVEIDERQIARVEAIILSMTPQERSNPDILNHSRKRRIAAGCGMKVEDINRLVKQLESMRKMMKQMKGLGKKGMRGMPRIPSMTPPPWRPGF
ncbi:MAG TPA: signal recognition particle protein [Candidatus Avimonas sp.]|nr:signal recognition particle protein [Candidatus Avimonas sp.]HQA16637.1 signal recognition particle protein [Candidatus Avimonas sp.]HQD38705.1 signal recognition particle protein [Candidatus Avimonas sp.]